MFEERIAAMNQRTEEAMAANAVQFDKRTYTVDEIQDILGISRTSAYNLVKKKVFHSVRIGGSIRISKKSFDEWFCAILGLSTLITVIPPSSEECSSATSKYTGVLSSTYP